MKGYVTSSGYMGYDPETKRYFLFATEEEYKEFYEERRQNA